MLPWIWTRSPFPRLPRTIDTHKSCSPFWCHKADQILLFRGRMPGHNRWTIEKLHLQWYQYLRSILPRGKHQWIFDLRKGQPRGLTTFVRRQRKTVLIQPGARLLKEWLMTGERRKKNKSKNQAKCRPFSAFHTPTLDSLCSLMFLMYAHSPVIRPKYFPYNDPGQKEGGIKREKKQRHVLSSGGSRPSDKGGARSSRLWDKGGARL